MLDAASMPALGGATFASYDVLFCPEAAPRGSEPAVPDFASSVSVAAGGNAMRVWWRAVAEAARARRHLVVVFGALPAVSDVIPLLLQALDEDPLFGTAQPRFSNAATDRIWPLPPGDAPLATRGSLKRLPATVITAEMLCACTMIRREVVSVIKREADHATIKAALAHALCQARRLGYRNVVVNRAVVASSLEADALYPRLSPTETDQLHARFPDAARAAADNERLLQRGLEKLLSAAFPDFGARRRLLVDCRAIGPTHNGTTQCILGLLDGLAALQSGWEIHVQRQDAAAVFHRFDTRYPAFVQHTGHYLFGHYTAILTPNQPWAIETVADLHRHGLIIGFNILDTIGWDVIYPAPLGVERGFRVASQHVDILTYISAFSRDRFRKRFAVADGVSEEVVYLSLEPAEQALAEMMGLPTDEHVLLFGNSYDHKGVDPAVRLLAAAFPLQKFVVVGARTAAAANVVAIPSGSAEPDEVHRLIATARAIVYPSYYEGFGLPVVEGLAYRRTVLVRSSPLWAEIAGQARFGGRLIAFEDDEAMVERLGEVLAGQAAPGLRFGAALGPGQPVFGWRDAAAALLALVERRLRAGDMQHWWDRAEALRLAGV